MVEMISDPQLASSMVSRGFTRAQEFSWAKVAEGMCQLYQQVALRSGSSEEAKRPRFASSEAGKARRFAYLLLGESDAIALSQLFTNRPAGYKKRTFNRISQIRRYYHN